MKVVIGFGKTGLSCIDYLKRTGQTVIAMDSREDPPNLELIRAQYPDIEILTGGLSKKVLLAADEIIVSPGLSVKTPELVEAASQGIACVGDIELFVREAEAPIIAITGSNGKTTLTTLMGQMIEDAGLTVKVCGNIGTPALDMLAQAVPDYYVMELSSFQLETTYSLKAKVAVVLNVTPDHMERYATLDAYAEAKLRIYEGCEMAIINADEAYCQNLHVPACTTISTRQDHAVNFYVKQKNGVLFIYHDQYPCFPVKELACQGIHNIENALAALAIGYHINIPLESMRHTLRHFSGLAHRCQKIASNNGVDWYNDSKATNIGATIAALNSLKPAYKNIVLIAGGDAKGADLSALGPIAKSTVGHVILIGAAAADLERIMQGYVATTRVNTLDEAVVRASHHASAGSAVLLSPACASWDMFNNYEERGNLFVAAVKEFIDAKQLSA